MAVNSQIDRDAFDKMCLMSVKYVLHQAAKKATFKRHDLVMHCLQSDKKLFEHVWSKVESILSETHGLNVHEIQDERSNKFFICVGTDPPASELQLTDEQRAERTLLLLVLSYIFMKGGSLPETHLWSYLSKLGIGYEHDHFGDVKKLVTETFVQQMYLKKTKVDLGTEDGAERIDYSWSHRAQLEYKKADVLRFVANMLNKPVEAFPAQKEAAEEEDEGVEVSEDEEMDQ